MTFSLDLDCTPLVADFCFVMTGILWCLFLVIHKPILLKLLTQLPDILTNFWLLKILTLKEWSLKFILLNYSRTKLYNSTDIEATLLHLLLSISNSFVSSTIYDKRDDFDLHIVFPFLDDDVPRAPSYGVYISHFIQFARVSSHLAEFNACNKILTAKLQQGYWYHKLRKAFTTNWFLNMISD